MKNEKLLDDLRNLLSQMQEMETGAIKDYHSDNAKGYTGEYYRGKAKACEILKKRLTEILYETKVEQMPEG